MMNRSSHLKFKELGVSISLFIMVILMSFLSPYFLKIENIFNILKSTVTIGILGISMILVIIMGGIDLSIGSIMAFSAMLMSRLLYIKVNIFISIFLGLSSGVLLGTINGLIITKLKIAPFIVTLGMMQIARGLTILSATGVAGSVASNITVENKFITYIGSKYIGYIPINVIILIIISLFFMYIMKHTLFGRNIYALGSNESAARLVGIETDKTKIIVYALMGGISFCAGLLSTGLLGAATTSIGQGIELDVIAAAVIGGGSLGGGRGTILGVLIGSIIISIVRNSFVLLHFAPFLQTITTGSIIILAVVIDTLRQKKLYK